MFDFQICISKLFCFPRRDSNTSVRSWQHNLQRAQWPRPLHHKKNVAFGGRYNAFPRRLNLLIIFQRCSINYMNDKSLYGLWRIYIYNGAGCHISCVPYCYFTEYPFTGTPVFKVVGLLFYQKQTIFYLTHLTLKYTFVLFTGAYKICQTNNRCWKS